MLGLQTSNRQYSWLAAIMKILDVSRSGWINWKLESKHHLKGLNLIGQKKGVVHIARNWLQFFFCVGIMCSANCRALQEVACHVFPYPHFKSWESGWKRFCTILAVALWLKSHLALVLVGNYANKNGLLVFCFILNDELWNFCCTFQCLLSMPVE